MLNTEGREHFIQNRSITTVLIKQNKKKYVAVLLLEDDPEAAMQEVLNLHGCSPLGLSACVRNCVEVHIP
jgi:hypothetical protein